MRRAGRVACRRRPQRHNRTTERDHLQPVAPQRLKGEFTAAAPNRTWGGDSTGVWTTAGWLYLVTRVEISSRRVVGWAGFAFPSLLFVLPLCPHLGRLPPLYAAAQRVNRLGSATTNGAVKCE